MKEHSKTYIANAQNMSLLGIEMVSGHQSYLTDSEGNSYVDGLSCASSLPLGYGHEDLLQAYIEQAQILPHSCMVYTANRPSQKLAEALVLSTGIEQGLVLFGLSGSDAIEAAIKAAWAYTKRLKLICFERAYHGGTVAGLAVSGYASLRKNLHYSDVTISVPYPNEENWLVVLRHIEAILSSGEVAGVLIESLLGDGGCLAPPKQFMQALARITKEFYSLLIVDEIQSGMGRTGRLWAYQNFDIVPDIICAGKALGGGYSPISACIGRADILQSLSPAQHAFTFAGHAASCAVAYKALEIISESKFLEQVQAKEAIVHSIISERLNKCSLYNSISGMGLMLGIHLTSKSSIGSRVARACLQRGLYIGYYGTNNNVLRFHPHLNIENDLLAKACEILCDAVEEVAASDAVGDVAMEEHAGMGVFG
jgi:4-aminobutyrate aminotransferase